MELQQTERHHRPEPLDPDQHHVPHPPRMRRHELAQLLGIPHAVREGPAVLLSVQTRGKRNVLNFHCYTVSR